jgi:hypothetical protein
MKVVRHMTVKEIEQGRKTLVNASKSSLAIKHTATEFKPATND